MVENLVEHETPMVAHINLEILYYFVGTKEPQNVDKYYSVIFMSTSVILVIRVLFT